ncbi:hypothetical protein JXD38_02220 [candidate division WOR-3 bacterium]|nr:hypothetical protein [candidate division WOR-3 bacterium]
MNLLLLLVAAFPAQRFVNLPTGVLPESHVWQVVVSHRFLPALAAPGWNQDPLRAFTGANVRVTIDKSLGDRVVVGVADGISSREIGVHAAWAPSAWFTLYPEVNTHLYRISLDSTWLVIGLNTHHVVDERLALAAQPRYTTNLKHHYLSLGLGAKVDLGAGYSAGLEAEPVLVGRDSTTRQLAVSIAAEKQVGWHDFAISLGTSRGQTAPALFRSYGPPTAYSDVLDVLKGYLRVGFNLSRKI